MKKESILHDSTFIVSHILKICHFKALCETDTCILKFLKLLIIQFLEYVKRYAYR